MHFILYKMTKRQNSTKIPNPLNDESLAVTGKINDGLSQVVNPVITLPVRKPVGGVVIDRKYQDYNYVYVNEWRRYYWVRDWNVNGNGTISATCEPDVLASYSSNIKTGDGYIKRTNNSSYYDPEIIDFACKGRATTEIYNNNINIDQFTYDPELSIFVIGVISNRHTYFGALDYYVVPPAQFSILVTNMVSYTTDQTAFDSPGDWKDASLGGNILKSIVSPMQYIKCCKWLPIKYLSMFPNVAEFSEIYLGPWNSGAVGIRLDKYNMYGDIFKLVEFPLPAIDHDNYVYYGKYINARIYNSLLGTIEVPTNYISHYGYNGSLDEAYAPGTNVPLYLRLQINYVTGKGQLTLADYNANMSPGYGLINILDCNLAVDIPIADVSYDYVNIAKSIVSATGTGLGSIAYMANPLTAGAGIQGLGNCLNNVIDAAAYMLSPQVSTAGESNGAFTRDVSIIYAITTLTPIVSRDVEHFGLPCNKRLPIHELVDSYTPQTNVPLYVEMEDIHLSLVNPDQTMLKEEYDLLLETLKNGVYIE